MTSLTKTEKRKLIPLIAVILISFATWLVIPYARYLAHGGELSRSYLILKGILVSLASAGFYLAAAKFGAVLYEKYSELILCVGTAVLALFSMLYYTLREIEIPVLARVIAYVYAALPFLAFFTLCAMMVCLEKVLSSPFTVGSAGLIFAGVLLTVICGNANQTAILILLIWALIRRVRKKESGGKAALIVLTVLTVFLFISLAYDFLVELERLNLIWGDTGLMSVRSRVVWENAKLFGTMDNLKLVDGETSRFSILWLVGFLGIVPAILILLALAFLIFCLLKKSDKQVPVTPLALLPTVYLSVHAIIAVLTNCGFLFSSFMTPMPFIMDTVAGTLGCCWLLGIRSK